MLAPLLPSGPNAVGRWLGEPFEGTWPLLLSSRGCKTMESVGKKAAKAQERRPNEGCPKCRRHVVLVIRGATQLARRLGTLGNPSCNWMIRATHSSGETRFPFANACPLPRRRAVWYGAVRSLPSPATFGRAPRRAPAPLRCARAENRRPNRPKTRASRSR